MIEYRRVYKAFDAPVLAGVSLTVHDHVRLDRVTDTSAERYGSLLPPGTTPVHLAATADAGRRHRFDVELSPIDHLKSYARSMTAPIPRLS